MSTLKEIVTSVRTIRSELNILPSKKIDVLISVNNATDKKLFEDLKDTITQCQERYKQEQIREQAQRLANAVGEQRVSVKIDISEELTKLHALKEKGIITEEDFQKRKEKILNS